MADEKKTLDLHIRTTKEQKQSLTVLSKGFGFNNFSAYIRFMIFNPSFDEKLNRILEVVKDIQEKMDVLESSKRKN